MIIKVCFKPLDCLISSVILSQGCSYITLGPAFIFGLIIDKHIQIVSYNAIILAIIAAGFDILNCYVLLLCCIVDVLNGRVGKKRRTNKMRK